MFLKGKIENYFITNILWIISLRLWRNEVEHKKRERTLQIASELRQQQQFSLFQVKSPPHSKGAVSVILSNPSSTHG